MVEHRVPSKRKKILVVAKGIESTRKSKADVARRIEALCSSFDVTIVTASPQECASMFRGARIIGIPLPDLPRRSAVFILCCWFLLPFIRSDVVYLSEIYNAPATLTLFRRRIVCYGNTHPMQHILSVQKGRRIASTLLSTFYKLILKCGLSKCSLIFSISPQLTTAFIQYGIREDRLQTVETGVPLEDFRPLSTRKQGSADSFVVIYHGTVSIERGLQIMIDGASILSRRRRDFRIRFVGCDAKQIESLSRVLTDVGILDLFELLPPVPNSEVPMMLWVADCGVSLLEPNVYFSASPPLKVLEYMAAGLPVIANDLPTHRHYLMDQTDSLIIEYTSECFADALEKLMDDRLLRSDLSRNAIRRSAKHSDSESVSRLIEFMSSTNQ